MRIVLFHLFHFRFFKFQYGATNIEASSVTVFLTARFKFQYRATNMRLWTLLF